MPSYVRRLPVRVITSPTRPIACESDAIMLMAPRSWSTSSAAMSPGGCGIRRRRRLRAPARSVDGKTSSSRDARRAYHRIGHVGFVLDGRTLARPDAEDVGA